jgi:hypothetical protein
MASAASTLYVCEVQSAWHRFTSLEAFVLMSNVVNFDRRAREQSRQIAEQRRVAEHAINRAKAEWKRLAQMEQRQR